MTDTICDLLKRMFNDPDDPTIIPLLDAMLGADAYNIIMDHMEKCPDCDAFFNSQQPSRENMQKALKWFKKINELNPDTDEKDEIDSEIGLLEGELTGMSDEDIKIISCTPGKFFTFIMMTMEGAFVWDF